MCSHSGAGVPAMILGGKQCVSCLGTFHPACGVTGIPVFVCLKCEVPPSVPSEPQTAQAPPPATPQQEDSEDKIVSAFAKALATNGELTATDPDVAKLVDEAYAAILKKTAPSKKVRNAHARMIEAWLDHGRRIGHAPEGIFVPDLELFAAFAADTLVSKRLVSLDGYAAALNKEAAKAAEALPSTASDLREKLTANSGRPWSTESFQKIQDAYCELVFAANFADKVDGVPPGGKRRRKSTRAAATSVATPLAVLDTMLAKAEGLVEAAERLKSKPLAASGRLAEDKKAQRKKDVSAYRSALACASPSTLRPLHLQQH